MHTIFSLSPHRSTHLVNPRLSTLIVAALALIAALACAGFCPTPAYASGVIPDGTYVIVSKQSDTAVLDVDALADKSNVSMATYTAAKTQRWSVKNNADGTVTIKNVYSGRILSPDTTTAKAGTNAIIATSNASKAQHWTLAKNADGSISLNPATNPGTALTVEAGEAIAGSNVGIEKAVKLSPNQCFTFISTSVNIKSKGYIIEEGYYRIASAISTSYVADIAGASFDEGVNAQLWTKNGTYAQLFKFIYTSDGYYVIVCAATGKCLAAANAGVLPRTNVEQATLAYTKEQKWVVTENSDGTYSFTNKASGLRLSVSGARAVNGANLQVTTKNSVKSQKYKMTRVNYTIKTGTFLIGSYLDDNLYMGLASNSTAKGINVQTTRLNYGMSQQWQVLRVSSKPGYYVIKNAYSGKYLAARPSGNVDQNVKLTSGSRYWRAEIDAGAIVFFNALYGTVLDISGASTSAGANIQLWEYNGTNAQRFYLQEPVDVSQQEKSMLAKAQNYGSDTGWLALVDTQACWTAIYKGYQGNWTQVKFMQCAPGADATPTVLGVYTVGMKGYYFDDAWGDRCFYYTQFWGDYLFHSTLYERTDPPSGIIDDTVGERISHGSVRLKIENAKWIYDNLPEGSTVVTY